MKIDWSTKRNSWRVVPINEQNDGPWLDIPKTNKYSSDDQIRNAFLFEFPSFLKTYEKIEIIRD